MKYTKTVTCHSAPLQIEGNIEDGRAYYFRARHGAWYLSIVPIGTDDMERVLPETPVAVGAYDGRMSVQDGYQILTEYIGRGPSKRVNPSHKIAYDGPEHGRLKADREIIDGKVRTVNTHA